MFGYEDRGLAPEDVSPVALGEITVVASANELRRIAKFLLRAAEEMEADGSRWEHAHLADRDNSFAGSPHFVVWKPASSG